LNTDFLVANGHIKLRLAEIADDDFFYRVYASTRMDEMAQVDWPNEQKEAFLHMQFKAQREHYGAYFPNAEYKVIELNERAIGRLIVDRSKDPFLLMDIALLAEHRNAGIGTLLIKDFMTEAAVQGSSVSLHVEIFNPAMKLYERLGFIKIAEQGIYYEMNWRSKIQ
jgi:ribosomal protein S18 acetylase RimI-like enzyme